MKRPRRQGVRFAVCIKNRGYEASLEVGKLYRVVPDEDAEKHGYLRIVDESGEDYGYAASRFFAIDVPKPLERVLLKAASCQRVAGQGSGAAGFGPDPRSGTFYGEVNRVRGAGFWRRGKTIYGRENQIHE